MTPQPDAARGAGQAIEQVSSRVVYDNPWMTFREDVIRRPDGSEGIYSLTPPLTREWTRGTRRGPPG